MKTLSKVTVEKVIRDMLIENTGTHMLDSGGTNGRSWQRNQGKTLRQFMAEREVTWEQDDGYYIISVFHYLRRSLELDTLCLEFNSECVPAINWDSKHYGVSIQGETWLDDQGFTVGRTFNSYNGDSSLSQVIQGTWLKLNDKQYLLLQIHGGCDVRGGYTDARLFLVPGYEEGVLLEDVYGTVTLKNGKQYDCDNRENGVTLRIVEPETGMPAEMEIPADAKVELWLSEEC